MNSKKKKVVVNNYHHIQFLIYPIVRPETVTGGEDILVDTVPVLVASVWHPIHSISLSGPEHL